MKKIRFLILMAISLIAVTSCGISQDLVNGASLTEVQLNQANYHVVKSVSATKSATYVLGFGGLSKAALEAQAVAELTEKANLTGAQALAHMNVTSSLAFYGPVWTITTYVNATVVEFDK